jgi:hypothetical protein
MSTLLNTANLSSHYTFGRHHMEPPPMPLSIQQGQAVHAGQMGSSTSQPVQMHAGSLPHDFDHLVRSIGEW